MWFGRHRFIFWWLNADKNQEEETYLPVCVVVVSRTVTEHQTSSVSTVWQLNYSSKCAVQKICLQRCSSVALWAWRVAPPHNTARCRTRLELETLQSEQISNSASPINVLKGSNPAQQLFINQIAGAVPLLTTFGALTVFQQQPWDKLMRANAVSLKRLINSVLDKILHSLWHFGDNDMKKCDPEIVAGLITSLKTQSPFWNDLRFPYLANQSRSLMVLTETTGMRAAICSL